MTDNWDRRTLETLVAKFYCPEAISIALYGAEGIEYHFDPESSHYYVPDLKEVDAGWLESFGG